MRAIRRIRFQRGFSLLEGLISIVIFSLAMLGLVGLQASSVQMTTEAKYRADAAFLADQLIGQLAVANPANVGSFAHSSGSASTNPVVIGWLAQVNQVLPGADSTKQQIAVIPDPNFPTTNFPQVTISISWQSPQQAVRTHTVTTMMQWQ